MSEQTTKRCPTCDAWSCSCAKEDEAVRVMADQAPTMTDAEKRTQVAAQCDVIVHLATSLANVRRDCADIIRTGKMDHLLDQVGKATARHMEVLGDILNGMDAVDEDEDGWTHSVFEAAQRLWPQSAAEPPQDAVAALREGE